LFSKRRFAYFGIRHTRGFWQQLAHYRLNPRSTIEIAGT
jgi:hypothetical protein